MKAKKFIIKGVYLARKKEGKDFDFIPSHVAQCVRVIQVSFKLARNDQTLNEASRERGLKHLNRDCFKFSALSYVATCYLYLESFVASGGIFLASKRM